MDDTQPLLQSDRQHMLHAHLDHHSIQQSTTARARHQVQHFLTSKVGHYAVLALVSLDVSCIFADLILQIFRCEHKGGSDKAFNQALEALGIVSLVFSSLFMAELLGCVWAFGFRYFKSKFHCFDATIIVASFTIDVALRGVEEEVASLVVVLRLWRVLKIIEELSAGAEEWMEVINERVETLEAENKRLRAQIDALDRV